MRIRHPANDRIDNRLASGDQLTKFYRLGCHALEVLLKLAGNVLWPSRQHLCHGAGMGKEIHNEGGAEFEADAFICEQTPNIEEVTWMLAVECRDNLAGIEVGEGNHLHLGETEHLLHGPRDVPDFRLVDAAA